MRQLRAFGRNHGFGLLIVMGAIVGALEVALSEAAPETARWLAAPAVAVVVLCLLGRRHMPFAAPVTVWLVATAISFLDGWLAVETFSVYAAGIVAAFLLGICPMPSAASSGWPSCWAAIVVYNDPARSTGDVVLTPIVFVIAWVAGFAVSQRAAEAAAAEVRATQAEREREENARRAMFEERVRIARELHDVVGIT